jgi:hypothetical protein
MKNQLFILVLMMAFCQNTFAQTNAVVKDVTKQKRHTAVYAELPARSVSSNCQAITGAGEVFQNRHLLLNASPLARHPRSLGIF